MRAPTITLIAVTLLLGGGCESDGPAPTGPTPPERQLKAPQLRSYGPSALSLGGVVTIMGQDFAVPDMGRTRLSIQGTFQGQSGQSLAVSGEVDPRHVNQGLLEWSFGSTGTLRDIQEMGTFRGTVTATNLGLNGETLPGGQPLSVTVQVLPSIVIRQLRPVETNCGGSMTGTTGSTKLMLEVATIGLQPGTSGSPVRFIYTFMQQHFQFWGYFGNQLAMNPQGLFQPHGAVSVIDDVFDGSTSTLGAGVPKKVRVSQGDAGLGQIPGNLDQLGGNLFDLVNLQTAPMPNAAANRYQAMMHVVARDPSGVEARRSIPLTVFAPIEARDDGQRETVQTWDPQPVSGCVLGGHVGGQASYTDAQSETERRSFTIDGLVRADVNVLVARLTAELGFEVDTEVTSAEILTQSITRPILPTQVGVWYRQKQQFERIVQLVTHGPCGNSQGAGRAIVTDWLWSIVLAVRNGNDCNPFPPSNLKPGQVFRPAGAGPL